MKAQKILKKENFGVLRISEINDENKTVVFEFKGEANYLALAGVELNLKAEELLKAGTNLFIIDLSKTTRIDSSMIGFISKLAKNKKGVKLILKNDGIPYLIFKQFGLLEILPYYQKLEQAFD